MQVCHLLFGGRGGDRGAYVYQKVVPPPLGRILRHRESLTVSKTTRSLQGILKGILEGILHIT